MLDLPEVKAHLRLDDDGDEDTYVEALIAAAIEDAHNYLQRRLLVETWMLSLQRWASWIDLPYPPLRAVLHIRYWGEDGVLTTLPSSQYQVDTTSSPGRITRAPDCLWPTLQRGKLNPIEITFTCGYGEGLVPEPILHALRLQIGHWFANRESVVIGSGATVVPSAYDSLMYPYRDLRCFS